MKSKRETREMFRRCSSRCSLNKCLAKEKSFLRRGLEINSYFSSHSAEHEMFTRRLSSLPHERLLPEESHQFFGWFVAAVRREKSSHVMKAGIDWPAGRDPSWKKERIWEGIRWAMMMRNSCRCRNNKFIMWTNSSLLLLHNPEKRREERSSEPWKGSRVTWRTFLISLSSYLLFDIFALRESPVCNYPNVQRSKIN